MNIEPSSLMQQSPDRTKALAGRILECNRHTAQYGLDLSPSQAAALAETRENALRHSGRIEFGAGITEKLIMTFCDSPYIYMQSVLKHGYIAGRMSDRDLASVSDQLMELLAQKTGELTDGTSNEKADLILDSTDSMSDFADLVSDGLLDREDIRTILGRLPAEVIEVLKKQYPDEFFMDRDGEKILCSVLKEFA